MHCLGPSDMVIQHCSCLALTLSIGPVCDLSNFCIQQSVSSTDCTLFPAGDAMLLLQELQDYRDTM